MALRSVKSLLVLLFSVFSMLFAVTLHAENEPGKAATETEHSDKHKKEGEFDPAQLIMEHILDAHEFHFLRLVKPKWRFHCL